MNTNAQPKFEAVTPERHGASWWRPSSSYFWAAREAVAPLAGSELPRAALNMPVAFIRPRDAFIPAAVLGLEPGVSLFVASDGRWLGSYVPAALRSRPFALLALQDGRKVLCVDEAAARVGPLQEAPDAQPFFGADGKLAPGLQEFTEFLAALDANWALTAKACSVLERHQLFVPWDITVQMESGSRKVEGLYRVDETAMGKLGDDAFLELRRSGALPLAYAQLISLPHLSDLGQRASARLTALRQPMAPVTPAGDLDLSFLEKGGTFHFS